MRCWLEEQLSLVGSCNSNSLVHPRRRRHNLGPSVLVETIEESRSCSITGGGNGGSVTTLVHLWLRWWMSHGIEFICDVGNGEGVSTCFLFWWFKRWWSHRTGPSVVVKMVNESRACGLCQSAAAKTEEVIDLDDVLSLTLPPSVGHF